MGILARVNSAPSNASGIWPGKGKMPPARQHKQHAPKSCDLSAKVEGLPKWCKDRNQTVLRSFRGVGSQALSLFLGMDVGCNAN